MIGGHKDLLMHIKILDQLIFLLLSDYRELMLLRQKIQGLLPFETDRLHFGLGLFLGHFVQGFDHNRGVFFPILNQNEPPVLIE